MSRTTEQGKEIALKTLADRRAINKDRKRTDNGSLPAGSPMFFDCLTCGEEISVPETYLKKPDLCSECWQLKKLGWLE